MTTIAVPITLQLDSNLIIDGVVERIRVALAVGLAPHTAFQRETVETAAAAVVQAAVEAPRELQPAPSIVPDAPGGAAVAAGSTEPTVNDWLKIYHEILTRRPYKRSTLVNHQSCLKHVARLWGTMPIRSVKPRHISAALQDAFGPDQASLSRRIQDLMKDVMQEAVLNEWVDTNPVLATRRTRVKVTRKRMSLEAFDAMAEVALTHRQAWIAPMLMLALATGQRRADLGKMRFDDVVDGHLRVEQQKEAGKGYGARLAIPLALRCDALGLTLGEVIDQCRDYAAPGPTMLRKHNGKPIELSSLSTRFNEVIRAALGPDAYKGKEWPSLHEMRSLSERLYRAQGIDTMKLLGHASQEMTDKYNDDRGLTSREWKRVELAPTPADSAL